MNERTGLGLVLAGAVALAACGGDDDVSGEASISGVVPGDVFAGRTTNVLISGSDTGWQDEVTVSFGDGVMVGEVVIASPTALWVPITVAEDATLGVRDVTVSHDGEDLGFTGAFSVISPLKISSVVGTLAQGSVATVKVQSLDFTTPFDTGEGNMTVGVPEGAGMLVAPGTADAYTFDFTIFTDVDAPAGTVDLVIDSGPPLGEVLTFSLPGGLTVEAREAETVAVDAIVGEFGVPGDSALFKLEPTSLDVLTAVGLFDSPDGALQFFILGESGRFDDIVAIGAPSFFDPTAAATILTDGPMYVVVADTSGVGGYDFEIGAVVEAAIGDATLAEDDDNDAPDVAQVAAAPLLVTASLADGSDVDWYSVVVSAENAGRPLVVYTTAGPTGFTDTTVTIFEADGATEVLEEIDGDYGELAIADAVPEGTYMVRVQNTSPPFPVSPGAYDMAIGFGSVD